MKQSSSKLSFFSSSLQAVAAAPLLIGGQAVVEGVMMKSKHHVVTAIMTTGGKPTLHHRREVSFAERTHLDKVPFVRGAVTLFETLILGTRELLWSASQTTEEKEEFSTWEIVMTLVLSICFALFLFKLLPLFFAKLVTTKLGGGTLMLTLLDTAIKFSIFVTYLLLIGLLADVRRIFQYHGAEHKSVNCYEAGKPLTVSSTRKFTMRQPRCGTTFVVYVFFVSLLFYLFIPLSYGFWINFALRVAFLPVIAGVVYEWVRFVARFYRRSAIVRAIAWPGMLMQMLTLREPDGRQLSVALAALKRVLAEERKEKEQLRYSSL